MKRLSLQWRLTLMTAVLIAATCIFLNLALSRAGMFYMGKLGQAIFHDFHSRRRCGAASSRF